MNTIPARSRHEPHQPDRPRRVVWSGLLSNLAVRLRVLLWPGRPDAEHRRTSPNGQDAVDTRIINATGDLRETRVLRGFHRRCEAALDRGRPGILVDLGRVRSADTKLIASLVVLQRRARAAGVPIAFTVSNRVYDWITICRVERLLQPTCTRPTGDSCGTFDDSSEAIHPDACTACSDGVGRSATVRVRR